MTPKYEKELRRTTIKNKVVSFMRDDKMFTSVDIANSIKEDKGKVFIRNREVAEWLRRNIMRVTHQIFTFYNSTMITVDNNQKAYLYHPHYKAADSYLDRDQRAKGLVH